MNHLLAHEEHDIAFVYYAVFAGSYKHSIG